MKKFLSLLLSAVMLVALTIGTAVAAESSEGFGALPAGVYTYVDAAPQAEAGSGEGQVQFLYATRQIVWAYEDQTGVETLTGDVLDFFQGMYFSDRPVTDWLGGGLKDVEGYAGEVAGNVKLTITEDGKLGKFHVTNAKTRVLAILTKDMTADMLTVEGITRGRPNLLQSCITLYGSTNGLYLTVQGDVILDNLTIGHDENGVGLKADKIGGDTFVVGTVLVDGTVEWNNLMGVILPLDSEPGYLITTGKDITMTGGSNVGRVGRTLNISTGEGPTGNITIGATVTTDSTRGGLQPNANTSSDGVTLNTSGVIDAGLADVVIGTNTEKAVIIDLIGGIKGGNVTIQPVNYGKVSDVTGAIGPIEAENDIVIEIGTVNSGAENGGTNATHGFAVWQGGNEGVAIGSLTSANGDITVKAGAVSGKIGTISAPNGTVTLEIESADNIKAASAAMVVDGEAMELDGYLMAETYYFALEDLAQLLPEKDMSSAPVYIINGESCVKMRDAAAAGGFEVSWDAAAGAVVVTTK